MPEDKINQGLVNLSCNCDVKSSLSVKVNALVNFGVQSLFYNVVMCPKDA